MRMLHRTSAALGWYLSAPLIAASFLTVVPVPVPRLPAQGPMGWPVACFPIVGAAIGGLVAALGIPLGLWFPPSVVAALQMATMLAVTGALHLDGLMDSFDGLFGGKDPAGRLAIMRDSRVGSYGVAAAGSLLLAEYGALASMPTEGRSVALILAAALSRWAMAATLWAFPAASPNGLAAGLKPHVRWPHTVFATLAAVAIAVASFGWAGLGMAVVASLVVWLGGRLVVARLGGVTGDSCGGLGQMVEATILLACVAVWPRV